METSRLRIVYYRAMVSGPPSIPRIGFLVALLPVAVVAGALAVSPSDGEDPRVVDLRKLSIPVRSVDPGDEDFSDLRPLGEILRDVRVVVLGEATHGEGRTFLLKTRLIRYLHQEHGFDVLAFESGFYDCWKAWQRIEAGDDPEAAFRASVFRIWTESAQVRPLIEYFSRRARSDRPLELAGIDPQLTGTISKELLLTDLRGIARAVGMPPDELEERIGPTLSDLVHARHELGEPPEEADRTRFLETLDTLRGRLRTSGEGIPHRDLWLRLLENILRNAPAAWEADYSRSLLEDPENYQVREALMGENIAWLARRHPDRKLLVWTHSGHAFRGLGHIEVPSEVHSRLYRTLQPAGAIAKRALGDDLYAVGFLAYRGRYATAFQEEPIEIWKPTPGSLEDLFHRTGLELAFLDLAASRRLPRWLRRRTIARPVGYMEMRARWPTVFDGFFFLDQMDVSSPASGSSS